MTDTTAEPSGKIDVVPLFRISQAEALDSPIDRRADYYRLEALRQREAKGRPFPAEPLLTLPNSLTLARVAMVPLFAGLWFVPMRFAPICTAAVFGLAAITDWLDGYLARRLQITSEFGAFLDPVADKIMVSTALVLLSTEPPKPIEPVAMATPVILMICREITMASLREWAATRGSNVRQAVRVNSLGKWKTALQMVAMVLLLVLRKAEQLFPMGPRAIKLLHVATVVSWLTLWMATILALWSLYNYMCNVWHFFKLTSAPQTAKRR